MSDSLNATHTRGIADSNSKKEPLTNSIPYYEEMGQAFGRLRAARIECGSKLEMESAGDIVHNPDQFSQGVSLLADSGPEILQGAYRQAASWMMPELIIVFPSIADDLRLLEAAFIQNPATADALLHMLVNEDNEGLARLSSDLGVTEGTISFAGMEILKPCIQRVAELLGPLIADMPWSKGNCPICGSLPDMAFLRPKDPEPSEYLVSKSGQLWLHCSLCSHKWRFLRSKCPHCGDVEPDGLIYFAPDNRQGERVYACNQCNRYFTCLDMTELAAEPDLSLAPLSLIHLDCLAQEKGFIPLVKLPWNQFSDSSSAGSSPG